MSNKKQNFTLIILITALFFTGCTKKEAIRSKDQSNKKITSIIETALSPSQAIRNELLLGNTILFSEAPGYQENIIFLQFLIPMLYDSGIREIGVWFIESSQQNTIDSFLKDGGKLEEAKKILSSGHPMANYEEYANLLILITQFNKNLNTDETRFRLIGLSENGKLSQKGLKSFYQSETKNLDKEETTEAETTNSTENSNISDPKEKNPSKPQFIWWKREGISSLKSKENKSKLFFLHAPANQTLSLTESAAKELILFEKALIKISPYDYVKAISLDSVTDHIQGASWDWYITNGPASQFSTLTESKGTDKDISSQWKSDLKKLKKEL